MSNNDRRDIMEELRSMGWFEFGAVVAADEYRAAFGISYPERGTKAEFDRIALEELGHIDFVRGQLLNEGKYLRRDGASYRILLPSENAGQIEAYMQSASNKLKRAIKLGKHTPAEHKEEIASTLVRAEMKLASTRRSS